FPRLTTEAGTNNYQTSDWQPSEMIRSMLIPISIARVSHSMLSGVMSAWASSRMRMILRTLQLRLSAEPSVRVT
ncbi:MAG: hypothetical protein U0K51_15845, partial [Segatella copri]|nr:hypothetical protein [Segatella copri]